MRQNLKRLGDAVEGIRLKLDDLFKSAVAQLGYSQFIGKRLLRERLDANTRQPVSGDQDGKDHGKAFC